MSENTLVNIKMDDDVGDVSLLELMNFDITDMEAVRGMPLVPEGVYEWRITGAEIGSMEVFDKELDAKVSRATVSFKLEALACRQVKDPELDPAALNSIGFMHRIFIKDFKRDIGRVKAFLEDIGMNAGGSLQTLLEMAQGMEFVAAIKHTRDKNDKDKMYANLDDRTISPIGGDVVEQQMPSEAAVVTTVRPAPAVAPAVHAAPAAPRPAPGGLKLGPR